ncbi:hypothetical protein BDZ89DRAFT_913088, partial [Hymenopellis radicata]
LNVVFTYDIACQWNVNFFQRCQAMSILPSVHFDPKRIRFYVPKFHLWAHQPVCHAPYSLNFAPGVGRTHGETIEENWSQSNRAAAQTKAMGPGARQDTLDDVFGAHNFNAAMLSFCGQQMVETWLRELLVWEQDHDRACPYEAQLQNKETMKDVELQLAQEEHAAMVENNTVRETGLSTMISLGLQVE